MGDAIRFGMGAVRNVGANVVESIIRTRAAKGKYASFADFLDKVELVVCNKRVLESLIKSGAFDSLGHTRLAMTRVHEDAVDAVVPLKRRQTMGQFDLFGTESTPDRRDPRQPAEGGRDRRGGADHLTGTTGQQEGRTVGDLHGGGPGRGTGSAVLPEGVPAVRGGPGAGQRGGRQGPGELARGQDVVFGGGFAPLDLASPGAPPLVPHAHADKVTLPEVLELRQTLLAHKGDTPVHIHVGHRRFALDDYPVTVTPMLLGELKTIPGFTPAVSIRDWTG